MLQQLHSVHLPNLRACYCSVQSAQKSAVAHCQSQIACMPSQGNCMPSRGNCTLSQSSVFKLMARKLQIMCFVLRGTGSGKKYTELGPFTAKIKQNYDFDMFATI